MDNFIYQTNLNCVLGQLFSRYRSNKRLDQYEAANLVRINKSSMSKLESGHMNFNIEHLFVLCEAYEVDLSVAITDLIETIKILEENKVFVLKNSGISLKLPQITRHQLGHFIR
jgi:transcriptional regulator with XRE-family HTH domain